MSAPNAGLYQGTNSSTSTLRPRNARLISYLGEETDDAKANAIATSTSSSKATPLFPDRGPSPSLSRNRSRDKAKDVAEHTSNRGKNTGQGSRAVNNDLWSSWSSIASSFLGSDLGAGSKGKGKGNSASPRWMKQDRAFNASPVTPQWGPKVDGLNDAIAGSLEDRRALLQAKKREALLLGGAEESRDASGRYKRRDSDADIDIRPGGATEEDALVYVHRIKREDTLPGVMLKYGCQPDIFRKVNRFWPNDNIQTRKHVFLPVEACSVRGKKVDAPDAGADLLGSALEDLARTTTPGKGALKRMGTQQSSESCSAIPSPRSEANALYPDNTDLKHDSWVTLPNFQDPVAILRIPRNSLGYFPRARRKSSSKPVYTDTSSVSTPRTSFDTLRHPPTHAAQMSLSLNGSPARRPTLTSRQSSGRRRSSSNTQTLFVAALQGPGGVGTLRGLRTEPSRPGPAEDPLNRKFQQLFPDLVLPEETPTTLIPSRSTPRASIESVRSAQSNNSALGEMGGAVEGWVRKIATNKRDKKGATGRMDDLIELDTSDPMFGDATEMRTPTAATMSMQRNDEGLTGQESGQAEQTDEELLNERFPVRGRVRTAYDKAK